MKALLLNSGMGKRMGVLTSEHPKCMTEISSSDTIISRQLRQLVANGISEVIITTGYYDKELIDYCNFLNLPLNYTFVKNPLYDKTNYIYSIYCAREHLTKGDILLLHGDVVADDIVFDKMAAAPDSCMAISSTAPLPEKDFKAQLKGGKIVRVGIDFFGDAVAAQPFYMLREKDWQIWLKSIIEYCESGRTGCYAENALNEVAGQCDIKPFDAGDFLCREVDNPDDLKQVVEQLRALQNRIVYMCFSTDIISSAHISIINKAARLGKLVIGVLSDSVIASYKRYPIIPFEERRALFENLKPVHSVVEQKQLSYANILRELRPFFVVHGDDWRSGFQQPVREEVLSVLSEYGGQLVEFPYSHDKLYREIERRRFERLSMPEMRRGRLRKLLELKPLINAIEAHSGITGLIAENTAVFREGKAYQFDAMWVSSLCDSTSKGKPDIELVDMSSRLRTIDEIMEVTTKPIILDGDTGGLTEHFVYNVRTLERMGVSAVIIEDKTGLKKNSLFGTEVEQIQETADNFCQKIRAGKAAQKTHEFMIIARIESLILEKGMDDALSRAFAYTRAGVDGIMIHSRQKSPDEIFEFIKKFRARDKGTTLVVVPTSFNEVTEDEFAKRGVNIVIYANQLTRSGFPAMQRAARLILESRRAKEADDICMPIKDIISLIPEE